MRGLLMGLVFTAEVVAAQTNWRDAGMDEYTVGIRQLFPEPQTATLLALGQITRTNEFSTPSVMSYRDGTWTENTSTRGLVYSAVRWGDTLLVAGNLWEVNGVSVNKIGAFYDGAWNAFGSIGGDFSNGSIWKLRVLNNALYAVGAFDQVDGQPANGIAKRENGQWVPVGDLLTEDSDPILTDVIEFQGDIYACGAVSLAPGGENGIIRYDGTSWTAPGGGILGGNAGGLCMAIYNDELVLGGTIHRSAGNPGHMIMRWNGEEWRGLGTHLRDHNNDTIGEARCYALLPYQDKLLVAGGFWYAGGVPASRFAIWDGENWCGTGDEWEGYGESLAMFNDTLFMASGYQVNGMPVNRIAKWVGGPIEGSVCTTVDVPDDPHETRLRLSSLGHGRFLVQGRFSAYTPYRVVDLAGRVVQQDHTARMDQLELDLCQYAPGIYNLKFNNGTAVKLVNY